MRSAPQQTVRILGLTLGELVAPPLLDQLVATRHLAASIAVVLSDGGRGFLHGRAVARLALD